MLPPVAKPVIGATGRMTRAAGSVICLLLLAGITTSCQTAIDPETGQTVTLFTLPGTQANETAAVQRWQQCIEFRSESFCEQNLPGGRPVTANQPIVSSLPFRQNDP